MHIIAADIGGTKTRLAFANSDKPRKVLYEARYLSNDFDSFEPMLSSFIKDSGTAATGVDTARVDVLTLAVPGLVSESSARLTNLPWNIEKKSLKNTFGIKDVYFMNDFQASAFGTGQLLEEDSVILNQGHANSDALKKNNATRVAVGAGTGLGVAWAEISGDQTSDGWVNHGLINDSSTLRTHDTEGGHIDFAPTNEIQIKLLQYLQQCFDHVSYERILSGDGLVSLYQFCVGKCSGKQYQNIDAEWVNSQSKNDEFADKALSLFVQIYGAYIGNIALLYKPYGGIYITGGMAAKIVNKMQSQDFMDAYRNKGRMRALVEQISVYLVTNDRIGVLGAMSEAIKLQQAANYKQAKI